MKTFIKYKLLLIFSLPLLVILLIIFLILIITNTIFSNTSTILPLFFKVPFEDNVDYTITSKYGQRLDPFTNKKEVHNGLDISANEGTNILASYDGFVIEVGYEAEGLGQYIMLEHLIEGVTYISVYGHLSKDSVLVNVGQHVQTKQVIGVIGSTGKSTGIHLHFEIYSPKKLNNNINSIDPISIFEGGLNEEKRNK